MLAGLGKGLLALVGGPIGLDVAGLAALGYGMNAIRAESASGPLCDDEVPSLAIARLEQDPDIGSPACGSPVLIQRSHLLGLPG
ncbi:hypothetical protein OS187_00080 [Xanthomonadaceae bacterium JHOS43]|nr:hypothetical protein [Xanthomonadaceae bacterium JHOS43]MCX7563896.1 hypothetical protein [Xanthomonadaceae bacterium XH05]